MGPTKQIIKAVVEESGFDMACVRSDNLLVVETDSNSNKEIGGNCTSQIIVRGTDNHISINEGLKSIITTNKLDSTKNKTTLGNISHKNTTVGDVELIYSNGSINKKFDTSKDDINYRTTGGNILKTEINKKNKSMTVQTQGTTTKKYSGDIYKNDKKYNSYISNIETEITENTRKDISKIINYECGAFNRSDRIDNFTKKYTSLTSTINSDIKTLNKQLNANTSNKKINAENINKKIECQHLNASIRIVNDLYILKPLKVVDTEGNIITTLSYVKDN